MKRIGIYGGTFNPPHIGHMRAAAHAIDTLRLDTLFLIPNNISPHKTSHQDIENPIHRLKMLELSAKALDKAEILDLEIQREGISYTCDTLMHLREIYQDAEFVLMMGTDMFLSFLDWYKPEQIMKQASLAVFYRGNPGERESVDQQKSKIQAMGGKVELVLNPVTAISSTDLRRLLILGCAQSYLCPGVYDYILKNGLYETDRSFKNLSVEDLEDAAINLLAPNRVRHVLGVKETAVQLARHYGENETDAARAGLLHDITKALDGPLQLTLCNEYGILLSKFFQENPKTLHALTGSVVADQIFGENENVINAIRYHTTGKPDMTKLQKIIYVADYMEPSRTFPGVDMLREAAWRNLDEAVLMGLEMTLKLLRSSGSNISPSSMDAAKYLRDQGVTLQQEIE